MEASRVKIISRAAAALYRLRKGELSGNWLNFLLNNADRHVHTLIGKAISPQITPMRMDT